MGAKRGDHEHAHVQPCVSLQIYYVKSSVARDFKHNSVVDNCFAKCLDFQLN